MSSAARIMAGITLLTVPTIIYGGLTVLGIVSAGSAGLSPGLALSPAQVTLYRAGHAHAGVLVILSLVLQVMLDHAALPGPLTWVVRVAAPLAAILVAGGFFGLAHLAALRVLLYAGASLLAFATITAGIGLLRGLRAGGAA